MSGPPVLGRIHFLSHVRRGIARALTSPDPLQGPLPASPALDVRLTVNALTGGAITSSAPAGVGARLHGPGDVIGIDPRHVIRTEPAAFTREFEPNYFAGIEFDHPDFPWLFTPAAPAGARLRPWVCLVALRPHEFERSADAPNPLPAITVTAPALPDLNDSWPWAHAQVTGELPADGLPGLLATAPGLAISRLLCPRRLDPATDYTAFLVPAFEAGRLAGLGQGASVATTGPAWTAGAAGVRLPVYYSFEFSTADQGDFESLVRRLTPRVLGPEIGTRPLDVSQPGPGVPSAGPPLGLAGALRSLQSTDTPWNDPGRSAFKQHLVPLVNLTSPAVQDPDAASLPPDPAVVPPIYGRWHAGVASVTGAGTRWIDQLNTDPRTRATAGTGTRVVDAERVPLLASAWRQVAGIERANELLRLAQMARAAMGQAMAKHLRPAPPETLLTLTAPVHARLLASPLTVRATIVGSRLPVRALTAPFRRVARPLGPFRRRQGAAGAPVGRVVARLNAGDLAPVPPLRPPGGMVSIDSVSGRELPAFRFAAWTAASLGGVPAKPGFVVIRPGERLPAPVPGPVVDSPQAARFRLAVARVAMAMQAPAPDAAPPPAVDLAGLGQTVLARLDPGVTIPARMSALIQVRSGLHGARPDPIEPIMAAPDFPQPMYEPLRDLDQSLLLPGVSLLQPETLGLLTPDEPFIEAYLVGLNHEMARQLLWEGYPTDQRGSYFRQFWDVRSYVPTAADPADPQQLSEKLKDITRIHTWPLTGALGANSNRPEVAGDKLVLIIRGELLRRYPGTAIYAAAAAWSGSGPQPRVIDDTTQRYPLFRGTLPPDITFLGFDLTATDARGSGIAGTGSAGWFFVFQQQPTEPRFGLEPDLPVGGTVTEWNQLSWRSFAFPTAAPGAPVFALSTVGPTGVAIAVGPDNPQDGQNGWGRDSAQTAYVTYRRPARVAVHADTMLPRKGP